VSNRASAAKAIVRRNTKAVQDKDNFDVFTDPLTNGCVDHTPRSHTAPDKPDTHGLNKALRNGFPDFYAVIHWQTAWTFLGVAPTGLSIYVEAVDAMRVHNGRLTEHWGAANLFSLMQRPGTLPPGTQAQQASDHPVAEAFRRFRS
jgi:hypothetical protein